MPKVIADDEPVVTQTAPEVETTASVGNGAEPTKEDDWSAEEDKVNGVEDTTALPTKDESKTTTDAATPGGAAEESSDQEVEIIKEAA